jgi:hypothetical protein
MDNRLSNAFMELEATNVEAANLVTALALAKENPEMLTGSWGWITALGFASAIEKIYLGCERALDVIAKQVDREPIVRNASWHRELLVRMSSPFGQIRPAVLSAATAEGLDQLRSFRHRARNTYGSILDVERVLEIAENAILVPKLLEDDLIALSTFLSQSNSNPDERR